MALNLNGSTFFIRNKKYEHARIAIWGPGDRDIGTHEHVYADQLWHLRESTDHPGYYYVENAFHNQTKSAKRRLAKWGAGDTKVGVYSGQYYDDQLWKFVPEGDYYRIYNKKYSLAKIAKWGKRDKDWGTYDRELHDDQLWMLEPRFTAKALEHTVWRFDNRKGSHDKTRETTITVGVKLTNSKKFTTKLGLKDSLNFSLSGWVEDPYDAMESKTELCKELRSFVTCDEEKSWTRSETFIAPAGKLYEVVQTRVIFSSPLQEDECSLYCQRSRSKHDWTLAKLPSTWEPQPFDEDGNEKRLHMFEVAQGSAEYKEAVNNFEATIDKMVTITSLKRVQNPTLYQMHTTLHETLCKRYSKEKIEVVVRHLFHGCCRDILECIATQGFNRSNAGDANASDYGQGVYFAVNSNYSADNKYAKPDKDGLQSMFICRVIIGKYTLGKKGMKMAPLLPGSNERYDTLVNDQAKPTIFVTMTDAQAYPEYLVTFKV